MRKALALVVLLAACGTEDLRFSAPPPGTLTGAGGAAATSSSSSSTGTGGGAASSSTTSISTTTSSSNMWNCNVPSDCGVDEVCSSMICEGGACGVAFVPFGFELDGQAIGDCQLTTCNGDGIVISVVDDEDVPDDANDCTSDACAGGVPAYVAIAKGTACAGGLCDGASTCAAFLPVLCDTGAKTYSACDGQVHTFYISYVGGTCQLAGELGYCPTGESCTVHTDTGLHLDGVCE